ncbi:MAG: hypothetical protein ACYTFG_05735 [Planctomycetota bacterium]|jgi:hypothetical protein
MVLLEGSGFPFIVLPIFFFMLLVLAAVGIIGLKMIHGANERRIRLGLEKGVCPNCREVLHCPKCGPLMTKNEGE